MLARAFSSLLALALVVVLTMASLFAVNVIRSDLVYFDVEREFVFWGSNGQQPTASTVAAAQERIAKTLKQWPQHPDYLVMQARLHIWQGVVSTDPAKAQEQFALALDSMRASLAERPGNPYSWALFAEYLSTNPSLKDEQRFAVGRVRELGAGDPSLQQRMQVLTGR